MSQFQEESSVLDYSNHRCDKKDCPHCTAVARLLGMARQEVKYDQNNNELKEKKSFIERHLELGGQDDFLIVPNGGSGDCMFKAVSQAVYNGDESKHKVIRKKVVEFITKERWEKFSESIEVQHINGNALLQRHWTKDPKQAYRMYMNLDGTLGSSSELTAAGELFRYNFATIQEYCSSDQRTYRVENCVLFNDPGVNFHYFYFTGDYDNGHWEYLKNLAAVNIQDGTYNGIHRTVIDGEEISVEEWLQRETENDNEANRLKIATDRTLYLRKKSPAPFETDLFKFNSDSTVTLNGESYRIADVESTDLFSVLAHECLQNEGSAHEAELVLMKHRFSYFEDVNYKLITQPYSHNFTVEAVKYCAHPNKGNIQDLISAADLYSFSFILYMNLEESSSKVHQCKFTHVDRWGGESDRTLYFFMRLEQSEADDQLIGRWWRLIPRGEIELQRGTDYSKKSRHKSNSGNEQVPLQRSASRRASSMNLGVTRDTYGTTKPRPMSADRYGINVNKRPLTGIRSARSALERTSSRLSFRPTQQLSFNLNPAPASLEETALTAENPSAARQTESCGLFDDEAGMETDECLKKDHERIFGEFSNAAKIESKDSSTQEKKTTLVKKRFTRERIKPATGRDLKEHPEKVKTLVRLSDRSHFGKEITYTGNGFLEADDVLDDLQSKGLIKFSKNSSLQSSRSTQLNNKERAKGLFMALEKSHKNYDDLLRLRDENFNVIEGKGKDEASSSVSDSDDSDVSYEKFSESSSKKDKHKSNNLESFSKITPEFTRSQNRSQPQVSVKRNKVAPSPKMESASSTSGCSWCTDRILRVLFAIYEGIHKIYAGTRMSIWKSYQKYHNAPKRRNLPTFETLKKK